MSLDLRTAAIAFFALGLGIIGFVLFAQHVQGYAPCELCLRERLPWYAAIVLAAAGIAFPSRPILLLLGLLFLISAGFGIHHAGVEQHWWPGPEACTGAGSAGATTVEQLRAMMMKERVVQCDAIAWSLFGISMAAYNGILSLAAAIAALTLGFRGRHAR